MKESDNSRESSSGGRLSAGAVQSKSTAPTSTLNESIKLALSTTLAVESEISCLKSGIAELEGMLLGCDDERQLGDLSHLHPTMLDVQNEDTDSDKLYIHVDMKEL